MTYEKSFELIKRIVKDNNIKSVLAGTIHSSIGMIADRPIVGSPIKNLRINVTMADNKDPYLLTYFDRKTDTRN